MAFQNFADATNIFARTLTAQFTSATGSAPITNNISNQTWLVKTAIIGNVDDQYDGDIQASVRFNSEYIMKDVWVPFGTNLTVINESTPIYMDFGDTLTFTLEAGIQMSIIGSYISINDD